MNRNGNRKSESAASWQMPKSKSMARVGNPAASPIRCSLFVLSFICKWPCGRSRRVCLWEISPQHGHMPKGRNHISLDYFFLTAFCGQDVDGTLQELQLVTFVMTRGNKKRTTWATTFPRPCKFSMLSTLMEFKPMTASNQSILITPTLSMARDQCFECA